MSQLKSRGLVISDEDKAVRYLESIGYYRLSAYMYPFLKVPKETHQYKDGTTFQQVLNLYRFDKKLRMLLLNEIYAQPCRQLYSILKEEVKQLL